MRMRWTVEWVAMLTLAGSASLAPAATTHDVIVGGSNGEMTFTPADITIAKGDSIHFENAGGIHNVRADDDSFWCALDCTLHRQPSGQPWQVSRTFNQVRTIGYYCEAHGNLSGGMRGSITVIEPVDAVFSDGFDDPPAQARR